jgi:hypothetical protein
MKQYTHMVRFLDPHYPTNLAIITWCAFVGTVILVFRLVSGVDILQAGMASVLAGLMLFVVWGFSREIDPQEQLSAFISVAFMTVALFIVEGQFNLLVLFYMLFISRIVNRSVGSPAKLSDSIALLLFTGLVGFAASWIYAMMGVMAFFVDSVLPNRDRKHLLFAGLSAGIMILGFVMQNNSVKPTLPTTEFILGIVVTTLIFIPTILKSKYLTVTADITKEPLVPIRVQATQIIAVVFGYYVALWQGNAGILNFLPLWLTIAGVALFPLLKPFLPEWDLSRREADKLEVI